MIMIYQHIKDTNRDIINIVPNTSRAIPLPFVPPKKKQKCEDEQSKLSRRQSEDQCCLEETKMIDNSW